MSELLCHDHSFLKLISPTVYPDAQLTTMDGEGRLLPAHRVILATVSTKFKDILSQFNNDVEAAPIVVRNIKFEILEKIIKLVYTRNVNIEDITEEDVRDGLHMLCMVNHTMGTIHGICHSRMVPDSQLEGQQIEDETQNCPLIMEEKSDDNQDDPDVNNCTGSFETVVNLKKAFVNLQKIKKCRKSRGNCSKFNTIQALVNLKKMKDLPKPRDKPYDCDLCPERYKYQSSLRRHLNKCHGEKTNKLDRDTNKESKVFVCNFCNISYKYKRSLRRHQKHDKCLFQKKPTDEQT